MSLLYLCDKDLTIFSRSSRFRSLDVASHFSCPSSHDCRYLVHCPITRKYAVLRLMRSFSSLFALVQYSAYSMAFVAAGLGLTGSVHPVSKTFPFRINVLMSLPPSSFMLRYASVTCKNSENRPPSLPSLQSNLTWSALSALLVQAKASLRMVLPLPNPFPFLFASDGAFS